MSEKLSFRYPFGQKDISCFLLFYSSFCLARNATELCHSQSFWSGRHLWRLVHQKTMKRVGTSEHALKSLKIDTKPKKTNEFQKKALKRSKTHNKSTKKVFRYLFGQKYIRFFLLFLLSSSCWLARNEF